MLFGLPLFFLVHLNKILDTSVIGTFDGIWKETCGQLISASMVSETFTTQTLSTAWIATVAYHLILFDITFNHVYDTPTNFLNSFSSIITKPNFFAFSYFEPGSFPTTT
jgi:hypothetical protein